MRVEDLLDPEKMQQIATQVKRYKGHFGMFGDSESNATRLSRVKEKKPSKGFLEDEEFNQIEN